MKLYEVTAGVVDLHRLLAEGEIDEDAARDTIESLLPVAQEKGLAIGALVQNHQAEIAALKAAEERIAKRRKAAQRSIAWFHNYLRDNMEQLGIEEISCPEFAIKLCKNPPAVVVEADPEALPEEFTETVTTVKVKKSAIGAALKAGREVPGCHLSHSKRVKFK